MAFILPVFIYRLITNIYDLLENLKSAREHKGQEVLSVSAVATFPSNTAAPRRRSLQGKACCSGSDLMLIASTTESKVFPAESRVYVRKL